MKLKQLQEAKYASHYKKSPAYQYAVDKGLAFDENTGWGDGVVGFSLTGLDEEEYDKIYYSIPDEIEDLIDLESHGHGYQAAGFGVWHKALFHPWVLETLKRHGSTYWYDW